MLIAVHDLLKRQRLRPCPRRKSSGFTLIEVMVAVLVMSIGLLGLASLQATGLRNNISAYQRTEATLLVNDILDRMRANPGGNYNLAMGDDPVNDGSLAGADLTAWINTLSLKLPSGDGSISVASGVVTITMQWFDKSQSEGAQTLSLVVRTRL